LSDWERANQDRLEREAAGRETVTVYPAYPREANLAAFSVPGTGGFRFYVDRASLSVTEDAMVRYALVVRSPEGGDSASYEGLRCASGEFRVYALGRAGAWQPSSVGWRPLAQRWHVVLAREYFCPQAVPIRNAAEGLRALEQGGHPFYRGFSGEPFRR
jgi:hypothetical protein